MLVLSRKTGERILIGGNIAVTVVRISQGTVRIGVEAPRDTSVVREEVILQEEEQAVKNPTNTVEITLPESSIVNHSASV